MEAAAALKGPCCSWSARAPVNGSGMARDDLQDLNKFLQKRDGIDKARSAQAANVQIPVYAQTVAAC